MKTINIPLQGDFVFIDIKTTGVRSTVDKLIVIDLYHVQKGKITLEWQRQLNPGVPISVYIEKHTGLNSKALKAAPQFSEIADELYDLLKNKIIVAHNARYVFGFLKNALAAAGYTLDQALFCTQRLARMLFPQLKSHQVVDLVKHLELDKGAIQADFLIAFFRQLHQRITPADLKRAIKLLTAYPSLPSAITLDHAKHIPNTSGVYRFYGRAGELLYVGRSDTLKDSIMAHFMPEHRSKKALQLAQQIKKIDWVKTVGELGALLQEASMIKNDTPLFNQLLGRQKSLYTIQASTNKKGYNCLMVVNMSEVQAKDIDSIYGIFTLRQQAEAKLKVFINDNQLCYTTNSSDRSQQACFRFQIGKCLGSCGGHETAEDYNARIRPYVQNLGPNPWPFNNRIAVKESHQSNTAMTEFHIIDKWCYLGSVKTLNDRRYVNPSMEKFDVMVFNIVREFVGKKLDYIELIEL